MDLYPQLLPQSSPGSPRLCGEGMCSEREDFQGISSRRNQFMLPKDRGIASQQKVEDTKGTLINNSKGATVGVCRALSLEKHLGN